LKRILRAALVSAAVLLGLAAATLGAFRWEAARREVRLATEAAPPTGRFVKAGDVDLFVQEAGPADGAPVLLVHGTGAWSETWRAALSVLALSGYRAIAIDLPPFGYSQRPSTPRYGKRDQGRRIVAVLDALKIPRAVLVGHSFGAGPTVEAVLLAPDRVQALVLVDAALGIGPDDGAAPKPPLPLRALLAVAPLRDALVATFLTNPLFTRRLLEQFIADPAHATDARVAVYQRPLSVRGSTRAIGEWLPALLTPTEVAASERPASYRRLTMPVYLIWGERDTITPLAQGRRLARLRPGAILETMPQVGHIPQIEDPAAFNALLLKFLAELPPARL